MGSDFVPLAIPNRHSVEFQFHFTNFNHRYVVSMAAPPRGDACDVSFRNGNLGIAHGMLPSGLLNRRIHRPWS